MEINCEPEKQYDTKGNTVCMQTDWMENATELGIAKEAIDHVHCAIIYVWFAWAIQWTRSRPGLYWC